VVAEAVSEVDAGAAERATSNWKLATVALSSTW